MDHNELAKYVPKIIIEFARQKNFLEDLKDLIEDNVENCDNKEFWNDEMYIHIDQDQSDLERK
jgi:hypothetical protein